MIPTAFLCGYLTSCRCVQMPHSCFTGYPSAVVLGLGWSSLCSSLSLPGALVLLSPLSSPPASDAVPLLAALAALHCPCSDLSTGLHLLLSCWLGGSPAESDPVCPAELSLPCSWKSHQRVPTGCLYPLIDCLLEKEFCCLTDCNTYFFFFPLCQCRSLRTRFLTFIRSLLCSRRWF